MQQRLQTEKLFKASLFAFPWEVCYHFYDSEIIYERKEYEIQKMSHL